MPWTIEQKLAHFMRLPWTVAVEQNAAGGYLVARIAEIPSAIATGSTEQALGRDLWESLSSSLAAYFEAGEDPPLPKGLETPWGVGVTSPQIVPQVVIGQLGGSAWDRMPRVTMMDSARDGMAAA